MSSDPRSKRKRVRNPTGCEVNDARETTIISLSEAIEAADTDIYEDMFDALLRLIIDFIPFSEFGANGNIHPEARPVPLRVGDEWLHFNPKTYATSNRGMTLTRTSHKAAGSAYSAGSITTGGRATWKIRIDGMSTKFGHGIHVGIAVDPTQIDVGFNIGGSGYVYVPVRSTTRV